MKQVLPNCLQVLFIIRLVQGLELDIIKSGKHIYNNNRTGTYLTIKSLQKCFSLIQKFSTFFRGTVTR